MPVTTYTEYLEAFNALLVERDDAYDAIEVERRECHDRADAQYDTTIDAIRAAARVGGACGPFRAALKTYRKSAQTRS